jgi:hypothetical protein
MPSRKQRWDIAEFHFIATEPADFSAEYLRLAIKAARSRASRQGRKMPTRIAYRACATLMVAHLYKNRSEEEIQSAKRALALWANNDTKTLLKEANPCPPVSKMRERQ